MTWISWISVIVSSLLSGLIGIFVSNWYHIRSEKRKLKLEVFQQLVGNRNDIRGEKFTEAINSIFVVFHDSKEVVLALKAFHEQTKTQASVSTANQKLLDLFKAISKELNINTEPLNDNFFLEPFNIKINI